MARVLLHIMALALALAFPATGFAQDSGEERRIALVIGNGEYGSGALKTAANDAGLVAQTLQAAGFDVTGARDLDSNTLRDSVREFIEKANASGPGTLSVVYFAGRALQFEGENYILPIDAKIRKESDIPLEGFRVSDLTKPLSQAPGKARIIILDAARLSPATFPKDGIAGGLALVQPEQGMAIAYNASPGTVGPDETGPYGSYASALVEMIKTGDYALDDVFSRTRMRVSELTKGQQLPWYSSRVTVPIRFFEQSAEAAPEARDKFDDLKTRPIREFSAEDAYQAALARDTFAAYQEFLAVYPKDPLAKRVRAIVAARREAMTWRETVLTDSPEAYWSYLRRYPDGPHSFEARRRLRYFDVAYDPPPRFTEIYYDVPPPFDDEVVFVRRRRYVYFGDPFYDFPPPPLISIVFLLARPAYFVALPPPPPPPRFLLPMPVYYPVPVYVQRPRYVAPPPPSLISVNVYNKVEVAAPNAQPIITSPKGERIPVKDFTPNVPRPGEQPNSFGKPQPKADAPLIGVGLPSAAEKKFGRLPKGGVPEAPPQTIQQPVEPQGTEPQAPKLPNGQSQPQDKQPSSSQNGADVPKGVGQKLPDSKTGPQAPNVLPETGKIAPNKDAPKDESSPKQDMPKPQDLPKGQALPQQQQDLPKPQDLPKGQALPQQQQQDMPKSKSLPKTQDLPTRELPKVQEFPKAQDVPSRKLPQIQEQPQRQERPQIQVQPQRQERPRIQEQPRIRDIPRLQEQPRAQEQPRMRDIPRLQEQPRNQEQPQIRQQQPQAAPGRKLCGKPGLPPCD